jgi:hypothetical protein
VGGEITLERLMLGCKRCNRIKTLAQIIQHGCLTSANAKAGANANINKVRTQTRCLEMEARQKTLEFVPQGVNIKCYIQKLNWK